MQTPTICDRPRNLLPQNEPKNQIGEIPNISNASYFDFEGMDRSVNPADDFYRYACGKWLKETIIPEAYLRWGSFSTLAKQVNDNILALLKFLDHPKSHEEKLCKTLYNSILNMEKRNLTGIQPLQHILKDIDQISCIDELFISVSELFKINVHPFISWNVSAHPYDNKKPIIHLEDGGIGLNDEEIYFEEKDSVANEHAQKREKYREYIHDLFNMAGLNTSSCADQIIKIEAELARAFLPKGDRNDPDKTTNIRPPEGFWSHILNHFGIHQAEANVKNPHFLEKLENLIHNESLEHLKTYLKFCLLNKYASYLGEKFFELDFNFNQKELLGKTDPLPPENLAADCVSTQLKQALGKIYVQKYFPLSKKQKLQEMVGLIKEALIEKIGMLEWMLEPTKLIAIDKVKKMVVEIGYPDDGYWKDYSSLSLDDEKSYVENLIIVNRFDFNGLIEKLQKPIDKKDWENYLPQNVNAYNTWGQNKITFLAAIFDHPFFTDDDATTWGGIGMVITHEMIHSFDITGRKYDADGNKADWWQKDDDARYNNYVKELVKQYNNYIVTFEDGTSLNVNGEMTRGENIADFGGLKVAYAAMKKMGYETIDGITPEQRFFLGFAQIWRMKLRDKFAKTQIAVDTHAPAEWRVNGILSLLPEFKEAFHLPDNCKMVIPENERSKMWG